MCCIRMLFCAGSMSHTYVSTQIKTCFDRHGWYFMKNTGKERTLNWVCIQNPDNYEVDFSLNEATGFFQIYAVCVKIKLWRRYNNTAHWCTLIDNSSYMTPFTNILISMESPIIAACTYVISYIAVPLLPQHNAIKITIQICHFHHFDCCHPET